MDRFPSRNWNLCFCAAAACAALLALPLRADEVSFRNDVMAVLSKAGCNAGACHGNKSGKGGFKLSLRGESPETDFNTLTREIYARRTNPIEPDKSLILLKATTQVPHEGGLRFKTDSLEYRILRAWIESGTQADPASIPTLVNLEVAPTQQVLVEPADRVQIRATATFSDGSQRDVTRLACFEQSTDLARITPDGLVQRQRDGETAVLVRFLNLQRAVPIAFVPARPQFTWRPVPANNYIDEGIFAKLQTLRMNPSGLCADTEFLRRAYLDLLGILPSPDEVREFLADERRDKRVRLIDALLDRPEYADFWALKWADLLKLEERGLDRKGVQNFHRWIRQSIADNKPIDQFSRELVSATGSTYTNPPANYYRANRDPVTRAVSTAQVFLGTRLQCAECHNHPFDRWTMGDYYSWADVFARIDYKIIENRRRDDNDKHEFVGEQIVFASASGDVKDPRTGQPIKARLLGDSSDAIDSEQDRLHALAHWMTSAENPFFARSQVNRIWYHFFGRGIVDPIDDFRATNPPSHPELLEKLTADFVARGFDARHIIRLIMTSRAYQLSSEPNETNRDDEINYSHNIPRRLTAEQLLDAQHQATAVPTQFDGYPRGMRAAQIPGVAALPARGRKLSSADQFLTLFGRPPRLLSCDCERSTDTSMGQVFNLISGPGITDLLAAPDNRLKTLIDSGASNDSIVEELYLAALSRRPSEKELDATVAYLKKAKNRRAALEDVLWGLMNSKEFILRK